MFFAVFEACSLFEKHAAGHYAENSAEKKGVGLHYSPFRPTPPLILNHLQRPEPQISPSPRSNSGSRAKERGQTGSWFRALLALEVAGMPRTMRMEYPGASYHVLDRGDRRESGKAWLGRRTHGDLALGKPGHCALMARVPPKAGPAGVPRPVSRVAVQARSWKLVQVCPGLCLGDWPARHSNGVAVFLDQFYLVDPLIWNQRGRTSFPSVQSCTSNRSPGLAGGRTTRLLASAVTVIRGASHQKPAKAKRFSPQST